MANRQLELWLGLAWLGDRRSILTLSNKCPLLVTVQSGANMLACSYLTVLFLATIQGGSKRPDSFVRY